MHKARGAVLVLAAALLTSGCGWAQYRAGPEGTGYNALESTLTRDNVSRLAPAWSRPVNSEISASESRSPLARNGRDLVVASLGATVVVDAVTGADRFALQHPFGLHYADWSASAVDGRIVVTGRGISDPTGAMTAHDLATGAEVWGHTGGYAQPSPPIVVDGRVHFSFQGPVGTHDTYLAAVALDDGHSLWSKSSCCGDTVAPGVTGGVVYFPQTERTGRTLSAFDAATGATKWAVPVAAPACRTTAAVVRGGRVYMGGATYDAVTGAELWKWPVCPDTNVVTVTPESLLIPYRSATGTARLQAVDAATGAARWSIPWNENASGSASVPAATNGLLFAAGGNKLVARDSSNGTVLWRSPAVAGTFSEPIVADGMVYAIATEVPGASGAVHAYALP
jgi:serine/threonine-protein kinase